MNASSATSGFFQALPAVPRQYDQVDASLSAAVSGSQRECDDAVVQRIAALYLPNPLPSLLSHHLREVAETALSPSTLRLLVDAETSLPTLHPYNTFGDVNHGGALRTSEGWRGLKDLGTRLGSVALGYSGPRGQTGTFWNRRVHQFLANHLWSGSAALVTCPAAMTDGAATLLGRHLNDRDGDQPGRAKVLAEAYNRLISFDPQFAWTSGQWMTERTGGSDVSGTETSAVRVSGATEQVDKSEIGSDDQGMTLGPWEIDGFKWFSSATDADMVVLLARTGKGISAFYAPMRKRVGNSLQMNGVKITRLKNKLGTKALPTAELEIKGMRGWLIGEEGKGTKVISDVLNTTRLWTAAGSVSHWARALAIARAFSRVRRVQGQLLIENAQHVHWMAQESVKYRAAASLAFLGAALHGVVEHGLQAIHGTAAQGLMPSSQQEAAVLLRGLTPVMKAQCSLASVDGVRSCMESLGGVGYCENNEDGGILNLARIFRDANVNPIWEGTVSVMAEDFVRVIKGRSSEDTLKSLEDLLRRMLDVANESFDRERSLIQSSWSTLVRDIHQHDRNMLLYEGRSLLGRTEAIFCASAMIADACNDNNEIALAAARRWVTLRLRSDHDRPASYGQVDLSMDTKLFIGELAPRHTLRARM